MVFLFAGLFVFFSLTFVPSLRSVVEHGFRSRSARNLTGRVGRVSLPISSSRRSGLAPTRFPFSFWSWAGLDPLGRDRLRRGSNSCGAVLADRFHLRGARSVLDWRPIAGVIPAGRLGRFDLADALVGSMNLTGAILATMACWIVSLYLVSTFEMAHVLVWFRRPWQWIAVRLVRGFKPGARSVPARPECGPRLGPA